ncbi:hypothetical protein JKP88DRAFT_299378 [Tribonema minus]|uniref:Uncharacterized protein n=1 Tax=Tribonema minus TaxID=303371 RepID=A0A835ZAN7_9STRA|nr:hypothetical protein JKP88DRAFT_299378 [Tribonema minus]
MDLLESAGEEDEDVVMEDAGGAPEQRHEEATGDANAAAAAADANATAPPAPAKPVSTQRRFKTLNTDLGKLSRSPSIKTLESAVQLLQQEQHSELLTLLSWTSLSTLMVHVERFAPVAVTQKRGVGAYITLLAIFESLDHFILPVTLFKTVATMPEPKLPKLHKVRLQQQQAAAAAAAPAAAAADDSDSDGSGSGGDASRSRHFAQRASLVEMRMPVTPLGTLRQYLCLERPSADTNEDEEGGGEGGGGGPACAPRTAAVAMTYALLGLWEGSVVLGKALFRALVLREEPRAEAAERCVDALFQEAAERCVDALFQASLELQRCKMREVPRTEAAERCVDALFQCDGDGDVSADAAMTIFGNVMRAETAACAHALRDLLPWVMSQVPCQVLHGNAGLIPPRIAALIRGLAQRTRDIPHFQVASMVESAVTTLVALGPAAAAACSTSKGAAAAGTNEKAFRRTLTLSLLQLLEPEATLRLAALDGLRQYQQTAEPVPAPLLFMLLEDVARRDAAEPVRAAAIQIAAEHCPHNAAVLGLLLGRCADPGARVRAAAIKLVLDRYGVQQLHRALPADVADVLPRLLTHYASIVTPDADQAQPQGSSVSPAEREGLHTLVRALVLQCAAGDAAADVTALDGAALLAAAARLAALSATSPSVQDHYCAVGQLLSVG